MKSKETLKQNDIQFRYEYATNIMHGIAENTDITRLEGYDMLTSASDEIAAHIFTGTLTEDDLNVFISAVYTVWLAFIKVEKNTKSFEDYQYAEGMSA